MTNLYNYNSGDYRDRYTRDKGWIKLLFNHGRPLQSSELIEIQSIMQDFVKQGMDTLFANGSILTGLNLSITPTVSDLLVTVSSGKFYIDGIVIDVPSQSINVPSDGEYNIGISINPSILTEDDDPSLRDPIKDGANYGTAGAARLLWEPVLTLDDPSSFTIGRVVNGGLIQKESNIYSKLDDALAEFTYNRTGNFCVKGLEISIVESSERSVNNLAKYKAIQESSTSSLTETQETYSQVLLAKETLDSITNQLRQANTNYQAVSTNSNLLIVQDLELRLADALSRFNELSRVYTSKKLISDKAQANLTAANSLLVDKVYISISPGVAYVEGYRININSPVILEIPKSLDTSKVEKSIFTYSGSQASSKRTFSLATNALWTDVVSQNTLLTITISKLLYNQQFVQINLTLNLNLTNFSSIPTLLEFLVSELNKPVSQSLVGLTISSSLTQTVETLRTIIKNNLIIEREGTSLVFTSTTLNEEANQIEVSISLQRRDNSNNVISSSQVILVDVPLANLAGAGKFNSFQLGFRPVADIISLTAELEESFKPIVRGVIPGTSDKLGDDSIFRITKVVQGDTLFVEGRDYRLLNQSEIDWSLDELNSIEPTSGTTYYVSFLYTQPLAIDKDFVLNRESDSIDFTNITPAPNQQFYVDYSYYLAKSGVIFLDKRGIFNYSLSPSSINPIPPTVSNNLLSLATFNLFANKVEIAANDCRLISLSELQSLVQQVKRNTLEIEKLNLDYEAKTNAANSSINPIGFYNTGIQDLAKFNLEHSLFTASFSPGIQAVTGGYIHKDVKIKYTSGGSLIKNEFNTNRYISLPYTSSVLLTQARATKSRVISNSVVKRRARIYVSPDFSFVNTNVSRFNSCDVLSQQTTVLARLSDNKPLVLQNVSNNIQSIFKSFGERIVSSFIEGNPIGNLNQDLTSFIGYISSLVKAGQFTVSVKLEGLPPLSEGYKVFLSGKEITNYTLRNGTSLSAKYPGTIKAKSDGTIAIDFVTPANLYCGVHSLEIVSQEDSSYAKSQVGIYNNLFTQIVNAALDNWDITYTKPVITNLLSRTRANSFDAPLLKSSNSLVNPGTIPSFTVTTDSPEQKFPLLFDSLSQTFRVYDYYFVTAIRLKIKSISLSQPLIVNLGYSDSNGPDKSYICSAYSTSYNVSNNATTWTTFTFTYPVLLDPSKKYSISLFSKDSGYEVYTAEIGARDILSGGFVGDQLYLEGELFSSQDGITLDKLDKEDLTFELTKADFNISSPTIVDLGRYGTVDNLSAISSFSLNSRDITPPDTSIQYQYRLANTTDWINFDSNKLVCLTNVYNFVDIRAQLISTRSNLSPYLSLDSSVSLFIGLEASSLVSKQTIYNTPYKNVAIILKYLQPANTSIKVYYSPNSGLPVDGQEWFELTKDASTDIFIDQGLGIKQATWKFSNSTLYTSNAEARTKFRFRIDFLTSNKAIQPTVKDIVSYVYQ